MTSKECDSTPWLFTEPGQFAAFVAISWGIFIAAGLSQAEAQMLQVTATMALGTTTVATALNIIRVWRS